jgi:hypothetical protein
MSAIAKTQNFYEWFITLGGNVVSYKNVNIHENLNLIPLTTNNLKHQAEIIKQKHNYKFKNKY